jgi:(2Fe-2S) ferredoxin
MKSILICTHERYNPNQSSCGHRGSKQLKLQLTEAVAAAGIPIGIKEIQCLGMCEVGPNIRLIPRGATYQNVKEDDIANIIEGAKAFLKEA